MVSPLMLICIGRHLNKVINIKLNITLTGFFIQGMVFKP